MRHGTQEEIMWISSGLILQAGQMAQGELPKMAPTVGLLEIKYMVLEGQLARMVEMG